MATIIQAKNFVEVKARAEAEAEAETDTDNYKRLVTNMDGSKKVSHRDWEHTDCKIDEKVQEAKDQQAITRMNYDEFKKNNPGVSESELSIMFLQKSIGEMQIGTQNSPKQSDKSAKSPGARFTLIAGKAGSVKIGNLIIANKGCEDRFAIVGESGEVGQLDIGNINYTGKSTIVEYK